MDSQNAWRPVVAVLANPRTRTIAASLMLGEGLEEACARLAPAARVRALGALADAGLLDPASGRFREERFRELLAADAPKRREGVERFLDGTSIRQFPAAAAERLRLLEWVARRAFAPGQRLSEAEVNERLRPFFEDVAALRRYLVDHGLLLRRADGGEYAPRDPQPA